MRLATRFVVHGALLPLAALLASVALGGVLFRRSLEASVDRALLAQAASESVSMFDRPGGHPHLHAEHAALPVEVVARAPQAAVLDEAGRVVVAFPEGVAPPDVAAPRGTEPELVTRENVRALSLRLEQPSRAFTLVLWTDLEHVDEAVRQYWQVTLGSAALLGALLLVLQLAHGRSLRARIVRLEAWLPEVRREVADWTPPTDSGGDELTSLRDALADAMDRVRRTREAEERLVANAAHELRTPLGSMRMELDLALRRERSEAELREALASTRDEVDRLAKLAARLLDLADASGAALSTEPASLRTLALASAEALGTEAAQKEVRVRVRAPGEVVAEVDVLRIRQALDNLLANAIRFAPSGSEVDVDVEEAGERARLSVSDAGPGVPEGAETRIFEPFVRASRGGQGAGLGLAIVKQVAQRHGGAVQVAAQGGRTVFTLELPVRQPAA